MTTYIDKSSLDAIAALQRPGKPCLIGRVVDVFVRDAPGTIADLISAIELGDLATAATAAHSVKSSSAYVGAKQLSARLKTIELAAKEGNELECVAMCEGLEEEFNASLAELQVVAEKVA